MNKFQAGNIAKAERFAREALAIHERLNVSNEETINILDTLLLILCEDSQHAEAEEFAEQALAIARQRPGQYPEVATVLHRLAAAVKYQGNVEKAEHLAREAVTVHRQLHGENHPKTGWALGGLGDILKRQQRYQEDGRLIDHFFFGFLHFGIGGVVEVVQIVERVDGQAGGLELDLRAALEQLSPPAPTKRTRRCWPTADSRRRWLRLRW